MIGDLRAVRPVTPSAGLPLSDAREMFRRGTVLVDAATAALAALGPQVAALKPRIADLPRMQLERTLAALWPVIRTASVDSDNLLIVPRGAAAERPLVIFALARQTSGAMAVQSIEIDRAALAMTDGALRESQLPFDRLCQAVRDSASTPNLLRDRATALASHVTIAASRLSIAKARLDLQSSFLSAMAEADGPAPVVRLESPLDSTNARDLAMATRQLLSRQSLNITNPRPEAPRGLDEPR